MQKTIIIPMATISTIAALALLFGQSLVGASDSVRVLSAEETLAVRGAQVPPAKMNHRCLQWFKEYICNTAEGLTPLCSGSAAECTSCDPGADGTMVWYCSPDEELFSCTPLAGAGGTLDCGKKQSGTCHLVDNDWFCDSSGNEGDCDDLTQTVCN